MKRNILSLLFLFLGITLIPYSALAQKKHYLRNRTVTDLSLMMDNPGPLLPGNTFAIGFQLVMHDGEVLQSKGFANGKVKWDNFEITVKGGDFAEGYITVSTKPEDLASHKIYLSVKTFSKNAYAEDFEIEINYVTDLELSYDGSYGLSPGINVPLAVSARLNNGTVISTDAGRDSPNRLSWSTLIIEANGERVRSGAYSIASDPRYFKNDRTIKLTATHVSNTEVKTEVLLQLDFKSAYVCRMEGEEGLRGQSGYNGSDGSSGRSGYATGGRSADGGQGQSGTNGQNGAQGQRGHNGDAIEVYVKTDYDYELGTVLKVRVYNRNTQEEKYYFINTNGGSLSVDASGGKGGEGGNGGNGGDGGRGGSSATTSTINGVTTGGGNGGNGGNGGYGGNGGEGGEGGDGGAIFVYADPGAQEYMHLLKFLNNGGEGGRGGYGGQGGSSGSGGTGHGRGYSGRSGQYGAKGLSGMTGRSGMSGPAPQINYQQVNFDW